MTFLQAQTASAYSHTVSTCWSCFTRSPPSCAKAATTAEFRCSKGLISCQQELRDFFVSQIRIVTVPCRDDTSWIRTQTWPLLSIVILQNQCFCGDLSHRDLVRIRVAGATMGNRATILVNRPMHTVGSESVWATWAAQQLAYQVAAKFPNLQSFEFMPSAGVMVDGQALSMSVVAQITKGSWSSLTSVGLQDCSLGSQGLSLLIQADWPVLKSLDVSGNRIDAGGMAILVKGNSPLLTKIVLSSNPSIDAVAIAHLSAAKWPLKELKLDDIIVTPAGAAELARLQLPNLNCIWLHDAGLTAAAMSGLVEADWPRLSCLSLSCNNLGAAMQHFFKMQLPALEMLYLTQANLTEEGAHCLALGHWPLLTHLDLDFNNLNAKGVKHIACGMWPRLQRLTLVGNPIGHGGAQQLTKGDWPLLRHLRIGLGMLKMRDSAVCLGLDPDKVQGFESDTSHLSMCLERDVSQSSGRLWPDLSEIAVWNL